MFASRPVLSQAITTAQKGMLLPPQTTWDIIGSAFQTCGALLRSQANRDAFLAVLNKDSPVNAQVLGQADIGFWRILALYNDINNPLFKKYDFDAEEFTAGAKVALQRFHDVQMGVQEALHNSSDEDNDSNDAESKVDETDTDEGKIMMQEAAVEAGLVAALGGDSAVTDLSKIMQKTWAKEAEENPDSLVAELQGMVTPEYFKIIEVSSKTNYLLEKRFNYTAENGEVANIALLSARAVEVPAQEEEKEEEIDHNEPMKDPSLENPPGEDEDMPVVAQIEVLYDVEQTFTSKGPNETTDDASGTMPFPEGKTLPRKSVLVGVFQGWLHGDPDGNESVRWKLSFNRPAWEFPFS